QINHAFQMKVGDAIARRYPDKPLSEFVEQQIYDSFPTPQDTRLAAEFHRVPWDKRLPILREIKDPRWQELGQRLLAMEASHLVGADETAQFRAWQNTRRFGPAPNKTFRTIPQAIAECDAHVEEVTQQERIQLMGIRSWLESLLF